MPDILVPRENVNDEDVIVAKVFFSSGSEVKEGDILVELETTKANVEVESPYHGTILHQLCEGDSLSVGSVLCSVGNLSEAVKVSDEKKSVIKTSALESKAVISRAARARAEQLNVDLSTIKSGLVSVADIERLASEQAGVEDDLCTLDQLDIAPNSIVLVGGGGHAKMCIDLLKKSGDYAIIGIIDDGLDVGELVLGIEVIGGDIALGRLAMLGVKYAINGVGAVTNPSVRRDIHANLLSLGFELPNLIHPSSNVEPSVKMGVGNQIMMGATVGSDVEIGNGCIVNSGAIVSHDCKLRDNCHVAPGAVLAGSIDIGSDSLIGMGATVYLGLNIGRSATILNGVSVVKDVPEGAVADGR